MSCNQDLLFILSPQYKGHSHPLATKETVQRNGHSCASFSKPVSRGYPSVPPHEGLQEVLGHRAEERRCVC